MSDIAKQLPLWWRIKRALRPIGSLKAIPGWFFFGNSLYHLLEIAHQAYFLEEIRRRVHVDPLDFLQRWGWLIGFVWFGFIVWWAATRPDRTEQIRIQEDLRRELGHVMRRFEALSRQYERSPMTEEVAASVRDARSNFIEAISRVFVAALRTIPEDRRYDYYRSLLLVTWDENKYRDDLPPTLFAQELPLTAAIPRAIERFRKQSADPVPSTASEQVPPSSHSGP